MFGDSVPGPQTVAFLRANYLWMERKALEKGETDDYWHAVGTTLRQLEGMYEGYVAGCGESDVPSDIQSPFATLNHPTIEHFLIMNAWGDLYQIAMKFIEPGNKSRYRGNRSIGDVDMKLIERCSAIIKLFADKSNIVFGHNTWDSFESLGPRIIKHYNSMLRSEGAFTQNYDVYFSSSPALLSSVDDYYTSSGFAQLAVIETTNSLYNIRLLDQVKPESNLCWMRVVISNQLAKNGYNWAETFARHQSGTYTNQWMSMDLQHFQPGEAPSAGFLTVFEEVPGLVHYEDQTQRLISQGYWPSYNNPFYADISEAAGYKKLCMANKKYCYDSDPRANLFRQYQNQVSSLEGGQWILSYNNWEVDAASLNDSCNAIACRGDLEPNPASRGAFGALDAKVALATDVRRAPGVPPVFYARYGPTHEQQPVFCWSKMVGEEKYSHQGQPDCFDYSFQVFPPSTAALKI